MADIIPQAALVLAAWCFCYVAVKLIFHQLHAPRNLNYPPGPPSPNFLLGHFGKMPMKKPWFYYQELGKKYGDVIYFRNLKDHVIVLNSAQAVNYLLEKQARVSSDRPFGKPLDKFSGWDTNVALRPYSDLWRQARRIFHQNFRQEAMVKYRPIQTEKIHGFLQILASRPSAEKLLNSISTLSQGIMMASVYGIKVIDSKKEDVPQAAKLASDLIETSVLPGAREMAIKSIPFIHLVPSIFPRCEFARIQKEIRMIIEELREGPFRSAVEAWKSGNNSSLVGELMSRNMINGRSRDVDHIKDMGSSAIIAAAETTISATATFFLAISLHPHVQEKAQEELDRVLGRGRIPVLDDRKNLPYIEAVYREVMRWHPALPIATPHSTTEDIVYNGYLIPKGAILHANIWAITHDPDVYPDPDKFMPERHLRKDGTLNSWTIHSITAYGFGRRVCVGRYFADTTLWLTMACVLATMDVSIEEGTEKLNLNNIEEFYSDLALCHPNSIPGCRVNPRFSKDEFEAALELAREN